jgi:hypothetical protein
VTKKQRTIWDDITELGREIAEKLDELFNPDKGTKPVPIPVPVGRNHPQHNPNQD